MANVEQLVMDYVGALSAGITNTALSCSVVSATGLPTTGNFRIRISDGVNEEWIKVESRSGTTLSWPAVGNRGTEGSTARSWLAGAVVEAVLTKESLQQWVLGWLAPPIIRGDYSIGTEPVSGQFAAYKKADSTPYHLSADGAATITAAAADLTTGGIVTWDGDITCQTRIVIPNGVNLFTPAGFAKPGDQSPARIYAVSGFTDRWLIQVAGDSAGVEGGLFDVNSLNGLTTSTNENQFYGCMVVTGNRVQLRKLGTYGIRSTASSDVNAVSCLWGYPGASASVGADGTANDCDFRAPANVGMSLRVDGGDDEFTGCHSHGAGTGTGLFVAMFNGHHTRYNSGIIEASDTGVPQANVLLASTKQTLTGTSLGQANNNPEVRVNANSRVSLIGCTVYDGGGLTSDNVTDMIIMANSSTARLTIVGTVVHLASANGWKHAVNNPAADQLVAMGNDFTGSASGAAYVTAPTVGVNLSLWNGAAA